MSSLAEVLDVFTNPHTAQLHDRQLAVLRRLVRDSKEGFYYRQLPEVCSLLELVWAQVERGLAAFALPLCDVVALCGLPVLRERSNEEFLGGLAHFEALVAALVQFLDAPLPAVQVATAEALREVSLGKDARRPNAPPAPRGGGASATVQEDLRPRPKDLNQRVLFQAGAVAGVVAAVAKQVAQLAAATEPHPATSGSSDGASAGGGSSVGSGSTKGGGGEAFDSLPHGGFIATRLPRDDDDDDGAGDGGLSEWDGDGMVHVPTATLKAELVSAMPRPTRVLLTSLVNLLKSLSASAPSSAAMVAAGGVGATLGLLQWLVAEPRDPLVSACVEVLWNCVEHSCDALEAGPPARSRTHLVERRRQANAMYALSTEQSLTTLRDLFGRLLDTGHGQPAKELRNEVLIVASFAARQQRSHALFRTTGFLHLLLAYATAGETADTDASSAPPRSPRDAPLSSARSAGVNGNGEPAPAPPFSPVADAHHFATAQPVDLELKRILWALLADLSRSDAANLALVVQSPLIHVLLVYLNVDLQLSPDTAFATVVALRQRGSDPNPRLLQEEEAPGDPGDGDGDGGSPRGNEAHEACDGYAEGSVPGGGGDGAFVPGPDRRNGGGGVGKAESVTPLSVRRLPRPQLRVLQQQAMSVLLNLAPRAAATFQALAGHVITLRFLDLCSEAPGEADTLRGLVQGALMLLLSFVGLPGLQEELGQLDAVRIMLARFNDADAPAPLRADAACILSRLCAGHAVNQASFRRAGGVVSLVAQLEEYVRARQPAPRLQRTGGLPAGAFGLSGSATEKVSPLIVGVVDCLWNGCVGNPQSAARLLAVGGLDAVLNVLEVCPVLMRHQVAGLVADLAETPSVVPALKAWKSDRSMVGAVPLLLALFRDEEVRLGFDRPAGAGAIANLWAPLRRHAEAAVAQEDAAAAAAGAAGAVAAGAGSASGSPTSGGPGAGATKSFARLASALQQSASAVAERALRRAVEAQDLRAKVAAVLRHVGYGDAKHALAGAAGDRATLLMCEHYVAFRAGEAWGQVRRELRVEGTKPIAADSFLLESKLEACFNAARTVQGAQARLGTEFAAAAAGREDAFFDTVRQQRDQEARLAQIQRRAVQPKKKKRVSPAPLSSAAPEDSNPEGSLSVAVLATDPEAPLAPA